MTAETEVRFAWSHVAGVASYQFSLRVLGNDGMVGGVSTRLQPGETPVVPIKTPGLYLWGIDAYNEKAEVVDDAGIFRLYAKAEHANLCSSFG